MVPLSMHGIIQEALVFPFLLPLEVWALVETVDLVIDDNQQLLVAPAARLIPG